MKTLISILTATFTVPGRVEVTQQVTINIKDVPPGSEKVVIYQTGFGESSEGIYKL